MKKFHDRVTIYLSFIAERISVRQLITQAGWDFNFGFRMYICMYIVSVSITLQECWLRCNAHARLLRLAQSRTMWPHNRQNEISGLQYKIRACRLLYREVNDECTIANSTFLVKQIVLSMSAFPRRSIASNQGSWEFKAKPDQDSVGWYETLQSCAAACRVVLISTNCWSLQKLLCSLWVMTACRW